MAGVTYSGVKIRELSVDEVRRRRNAQTKAAAGTSRRGRDGKSTKTAKAVGSARWMEVTLVEGKNHEVRHIIAHLGLSVSKLERVRFGPYDLHWLQPGDVLKTPLKDEIKEYVGPGWNWG
jgi:pseudouridine synthase